jgi:hypothetical protein
MGAFFYGNNQFRMMTNKPETATFVDSKYAI